MLTKELRECVSVRVYCEHCELKEKEYSCVCVERERERERIALGHIETIVRKDDDDEMR